MRFLPRLLIDTVAAAAMLTVAVVAQAETCTLELKRLEPQDRMRPVFNNQMDYIYRATYPQYAFAQMQPDGKGGVRYMGNDQNAAAFKKLVKKEPKYQSECPFRGVAKLGTQEYIFALDASAPPEPKDAKLDKEKVKTEPKANSAIDKLKEKLSKEPVPLKPVLYNRLYFDFNHNGDLTDDKVIEGKVETHQIARAAGAGAAPQSYSHIQFPRIDVTILADGTPMESCFFMTGYVNSMRDYTHVQIMFNAGAYREGHITLEGKERHVVLIDFNSNGRFDDEIKIRKNIGRLSTPGRSERLYPEQGDMLLIDPTPPTRGSFESPYDVTSSEYRHNVTKLVNIDGRYYDLKIAPAGDKLTLTPSAAPLGNLTNPNDDFRAMIYNDTAILKIHGSKGTPTPVPEGQWKLLSYTITHDDIPKPSEPAEKKQQKDEKKGSQTKSPLLDSLAKTAERFLGVGPGRSSPPSVVTAYATADYKPVKVVKGQTVEMPFGPPYTPTVTIPPYMMNQGQIALEMALIGSAGEICSNMTVNGGRPSKPQFTITDDKGKEVQQGSFEYG
jgi:hypothetical protein